MKCLSFILLLIGSGAANLQLQWTKFKVDHGKTYPTVEEEAKRFEIFQQTLRRIEKHNAKYERGEVSYYMGVNQFSDLTVEERNERYLREINPPPKSMRRESAKVNDLKDVPDTIDWRDKNVVSSVKDQLYCGGCYAFAAIGAVESSYAIAGKGLYNLSVQQLLDCSYGETYLNYGCNGGIIEGSIHYVIDHGIQSWDTYPYESFLGACRAEDSLNIASASAYENVPEDENLLKNAVGGIAPVAACIDASEFFDYEGGILEGEECIWKATNHVILIVGYGTENGTDYWLVKNSWGANWGLNGYVKVRRNHGNNFCIATYTAYAIV